MLRIWCILFRFRKIVCARVAAAPAVAVLLCGIGTGFALVMFVASVEAFALRHHVWVMLLATRFHLWPKGG
jgi:hypothetical protein